MIASLPRGFWIAIAYMAFWSSLIGLLAWLGRSAK